MLRLSRMTDYSVLVLSRMAAQPEQLFTAAALAHMTALPAPTVAKALKTLARANIVVSERGSSGGYLLAHAAADITVGTIIAAVDGPVALVACADGVEGQCAVENLCPMRGHWDPLNQAVLNALESVSLADMMVADYAVASTRQEDTQKTPIAKTPIEFRL